MSSFDGHREEGRPTLPPVRYLFREELSRSPRPPVNSPPPWIVPPGSGERDPHRPSRAGPHPDSYLNGPSFQSLSASSSSLHPRHDTRVTSYSGAFNSQGGRANSPTPPFHSQNRHTRQERAPFDAMQGRSRDQAAAPAGHQMYFNQSPQPYSGGTYQPVVGTSTRHVGSAQYPEVGRVQHQRREPLVGSSTSGAQYNPPAPSTSTMKYECEYCGKGFTRPSSLKVRYQPDPFTISLAQHSSTDPS
ncbi:hypothetical protein J3A83DRAFT_4371463 [Scleroderma citrinum]